MAKYVSAFVKWQRAFDAKWKKKKPVLWWDSGLLGTFIKAKHARPIEKK